MTKNGRLHETLEGGQLSDIQFGGLDLLELEAAMSERSTILFEKSALHHIYLCCCCH